MEAPKDRGSNQPATKRAKNPDAQGNPYFDEAPVEDKLSAKSASDGRGKILPTTRGRDPTKKHLIVKYHVNSPRMTAFDIARKADTTVNYVYKVLSEARKPSKEVRGRRGRLFAHGKVWYEYWVPRSWLKRLEACIVNSRTGMRQVGFKSNRDPCSVQIHPNGHLVIWPRSSGWRGWLVEELSLRGWSRENSRVVVDHAQLTVSMAEGGVKPGDPGFLPKEIYLETEWGVVICKDDSPEKSVLELKLSIPKMQSYLGIPDIMKRLEGIEQGSMTVAQRQRAIEALLYTLIKLLQKGPTFSGTERDSKP